MTNLPEPWQLYPMPPEQVAKIRAYMAARVEREVEATADEKDRLLYATRRFLGNLAAAPGPQSQQQREHAEVLAQRIVDEIGHSVTDEPALGPEMRAQLADMRSALDEANGRAADVAGAVANLLRATDPTDPAYDGVRRAYGVALEAAGLAPEGMS